MSVARKGVRGGGSCRPFGQLKKLRIAEIFESIQGEGIWSGTPSVFVRVSGCNLRCVWCDTPYASWSPEGPVMTVGEILETVAAYESEHVIVTGGEPMMFSAVIDLCQGLRALGRTITVETAGTVFRKVECDLMSISPKLSNSTPPSGSGWKAKHEDTRTNINALSFLISDYNYQLKFVIGDNPIQDVEEIESLLTLLPDVDSNRILLMPEGTDVETLNNRMTTVYPIATERNWGTSPRLQIEMFGNTRGT